MTSRAQEIRRLERFATWLDSRFVVPGTGLAVGLDSLAGLVPGVGDGAGAIASLYLLIKAYRLGVRKRTVFMMAVYVLVDFVLGAVPLIGDLFDIGFKVNLRNVALIKADLEAQGQAVALAY